MVDHEAEFLCALERQRKELEKEEEEVACLKIKVKEAKKREDILTSHLKEIFEDLNKIEAEFSQQERIFEEEIISLKTQLEEAKTLEFLEAYVTSKEKTIRLENLTLGLMKAYSLDTQEKTRYKNVIT
jgi:hypothetical protein